MRDFRIQLTDLRQRIGLAHEHRRDSGHGVLRHLTRKQVVERRADTVYIAASIGTSTADLFERCVVRRIAANARAPAFLRLISDSFGQTEIKKNNLTTRGQLEILRFDIAMDDSRFL